MNQNQTETLLDEIASLNANLNYYQAIFDAMPDAMLISNERGIITMANRQAESLLGYSVDELAGMSIELLIPERLRKLHVEHRIKFSTGSEARLMGEKECVKVLRKDGTELHVEISLSPIKTEQGLLFASAIRDVTERLKTQQTLRDKEQMLSESQRIAHVASWLFDLKTKRFTWSEEMYRIYGIKPELFEGTFESFLNLVHPEDRALLETWMDNCQSGKKPPELDFRIIVHGGEEVRFIRRTADLHYDSQGNPVRIVGCSQDITERKKLELEKEQFFKFFNFALDIECIVDLNGVFKQVNPAFCKTLGYSQEEFSSSLISDLVVPEDWQRTLAEMKKLAQNNVTLGFENRYFRKNGSICWLSWNAFFNPDDSLIYAVARDVTVSKKIEERLQLADMVYENSIEGIVVTDANNRIISVNPAFTEITGYSVKDVIGQNPRIFKSGLHDEQFYRNMWQHLNTRGFWQGEIWDKRKNGDLHAKFLNIKAICNADGQVYRYLAIFSDITSRKRYEEEIKRLSESELNKAKIEAEKASRAKSDFLSSMSHELRTPMNAVLGFAQLLELEALNEEQQDSVQQILTAGRHLLDLINQVLDLSKIEAEKIDINLENIYLSPMVNHCINLVKPLQTKYKVSVVDNTIECQCQVIADSLHLKQVLLNLISNAIKYNKPSGTVTIFCESIHSHTLKINVADTGHGLSEEQLAKLFQPFERLSAKNSNIEGSGVGLVITKKLIESMHGKIGVQSIVGKGSCFWIEIPRAQSS